MTNFGNCSQKPESFAIIKAAAVWWTAMIRHWNYLNQNAFTERTATFTYQNTCRRREKGYKLCIWLHLGELTPVSFCHCLTTLFKKKPVTHCHVLKKPLISDDDAEISHSIPNFLHFLERELRYKSHFQQTVDIAGKILVSVAPTVA